MHQLKTNTLIQHGYIIRIADIVTRPENKTMTDFQSLNNLTVNYQAVKAQLSSACQASARQNESVCLLAVSKKHSMESIKHIHSLGQAAFGENYVQEGVDKVQALADLNIQWHFIGPIQSNKSRLVAEHFDWVHTIDRLKIAQRLNEQRPQHFAPLNVLIQVNISQQASKSGITLAEVDGLASAISDMGQLTLKGLMCIPAPQDETQLAQDFERMQTAFTLLQNRYPQVDTLSMGMSADYREAIAEGSTMIRIGTDIFGQRQ